MRFTRALTVVVLSCGPILSTQAETQTEGFDGAEFTNSFFQHDLEYPPPSWFFIDPDDPDGDFVLYLIPNVDVVTFHLGEGETVESISVNFTDFEGGFVGNVTSSAVIVRGDGGDFVVLHSAELGVEETLTADVNTLGQLEGLPIGNIISIDFQVANEGNSEVPGVGAYIDDITVEVVSDKVCEGDVNGDGEVDPLDSGFVLARFGCPVGTGDADCDEADANADGAVDPLDVGFVLARFGECS